MKKITKDTTLKEVLMIEGSLEVLMENNVPCITCPFAKAEMDKLKIGEICDKYNIDCELLLTELSMLEGKKKK
jgi:hypothetical protein